MQAMHNDRARPSEVNHAVFDFAGDINFNRSNSHFWLEAIDQSA